MIEIYIVAGFLGAGKTTFIQKLLTEAFQGKKIALIENDFGEVSVDAAVLKGGGYRVEELNGGCICCTLTGNFVNALEALIKNDRPQIIVIEPSGVGKLSDVERACQNAVVASEACVVQKITVVDLLRCERYLENFGEFFTDQIAHADTVLFSRTDSVPDALSQAQAIVEPWNPRAAVFAEEWEHLSVAELLQAKKLEGMAGRLNIVVCHDDHCICHDHSQHCTAAEAFDTLTLRILGKVRVPEITARLSELSNLQYGAVLRAKGILESSGQFLQLQFVPGELQIEKTDVKGHELCIIGQDLNKELIITLFANV